MCDSDQTEKPAGAAISSDVLDLTDEPSKDREQEPREGGDYDPRPVEDGARRILAFLLIGLLWLIIAAILILVAFETISVRQIKDFDVLLSPIIALVSAATGFYYGAKSGAK